MPKATFAPGFSRRPGLARRFCLALFCALLLALPGPAFGSAPVSAPVPEISGAAENEPSGRLTGREAYAAHLAQKMFFRCEAEASLRASGFSGTAQYGQSPPYERHVDLLYAARNHPALFAQILQTAANAGLSPDERAKKLESFDYSLRSLKSSYFMREASKHLEEAGGEKPGSDKAFRALLEFELEQEARLDFLLQLAELFDCDLSKGQARLPLDDEQLRYLWEKQPSERELRNLQSVVASLDYGRLELGELEKALEGPEAFLAERRDKKLQEEFVYLFQAEGGKARLDGLLDPTGLDALKQWGFLPYRPFAHRQKLFPDLPEGKLENGLAVKRLPLPSKDANNWPKEEPEAENKFYGLSGPLSTLPRSQSSLPLWQDTPLDSLAPRGPALHPLRLDEGQFWLRALNPGAGSSLETALILESALSLESTAAHLAGLSFVQASQDSVDLAQGLYAPARLDHAFLWMAVNGGAAELERLFGPLTRVWVFWPGASPEKPWVELTLENPDPAYVPDQRILSFDAGARRAVFTPLEEEALLRQTLATLHRELPEVIREYPEARHLADLSPEELEQAARRMVGLAVANGLGSRRGCEALLQGYLLLGPGEESYAQISGFIGDQSKTPGERMRAYLDWIYEVSLERGLE